MGDVSTNNNASITSNASNTNNNTDDINSDIIWITGCIMSDVRHVHQINNQSYYCFTLCTDPNAHDFSFYEIRITDIHAFNNLRNSNLNKLQKKICIGRRICVKGSLYIEKNRNTTKVIYCSIKDIGMMLNFDLCNTCQCFVCLKPGFAFKSHATSQFHPSTCQCFKCRTKASQLLNPGFSFQPFSISQFHPSTCQCFTCRAKASQLLNPGFSFQPLSSPDRPFGMRKEHM